MAKKKASHSHKEKSPQNQEDFAKAHQKDTPVMDSEAAEKLESLKSLNRMLLKEAFERRQAVESLEQSKWSLEMELTRSNTERDALKSELSLLVESAARLELERSVVSVLVAAQVAQKGEDIEQKMKSSDKETKALRGVIEEKESEIGRLNGKLTETEGALGNEREVLRRICVERDELKDKVDLQNEESKRLRASLSELEEGKGEAEREIGELRVAYDRVVGDKEELEMRIKSMTSERDSIERSLVDCKKSRDELKEKLRRVVSDKRVVEEEKDVEMVKRKGLENDLRGLKKMVVGLQKEEGKLRENVAVLENQRVESEERLRGMRKEIDRLMGERKLNEKRIEGLLDEKTVLEKDLGEAFEQLGAEMVKREELVNERNVMVETKGRLDNKVGALQNQVVELNAAVSKLEESKRVEVEKIKCLESEVEEYRCKLQLVKVDRDDMGNCLREEKENAVILKETIGELAKKFEESQKSAGEAKAENAAMFAAKAALENECETLKKKITSLEIAATEARNECDSMKGKAELADSKSELLLNMLKDTSAFCSKDENDAEDGDSVVDERINGEEAKPHVMEVEVIKKAFKIKETKVENMRRQVEFLQSSVEEAHKKKGFWTMLSSATTLVAAVSLAFVARGH